MEFFKVDQAVKKFGGLTAVNRVSMEVKKGEIFGLIGPNGSGKTTMFNLISGSYPLTSGEIYFKGQRIDHLTTHEICRLGIGRTFQVVKPLGRMTVLDNVMIGSFLRNPGAKQARDKALDILEFTKLIHLKDKLARGLTIAERKRLEIARAIATEPELLLLDETAAGLNPKEQEEAMRIIAKIRESGITVILVEHVMKVMMGLADRILVINFGKEITMGKPQEVVQNPEVIKAYLGDEYA